MRLVSFYAKYSGTNIGTRLNSQEKEGSNHISKQIAPDGNFRRGHFTLAAATAAAREEYNENYDDPPNVIAAEKIAKTVVHKKNLRKYF